MRRIRIERELTQQALAVRLGISASYLNLIEHEQRAVTASLLIKAAEILNVDLATLSGTAERQIETQLREVFSDKLPASNPVPEGEIALLRPCRGATRDALGRARSRSCPGDGMRHWPCRRPGLC